MIWPGPQSWGQSPVEAVRDPGTGPGRGVKQGCAFWHKTVIAHPVGPRWALTSPELPYAGERQAARECPWVPLPSKAEGLH